MYCGSCGKDIPNDFRFCSQCGAPASQDYGAPKQVRVLRRPHLDRKIAGVCAGLANYMEIDVTLVRIVFLVLLLWPPGTGLILYIVCWIVTPQEPYLLPPAAPQRVTPPLQS